MGCFKFVLYEYADRVFLFNFEGAWFVGDAFGFFEGFVPETCYLFEQFRMMDSIFGL